MMPLPLGWFYGSFGVGRTATRCRGCQAPLVPGATDPFCSDQCAAVWEAKA